MKYTKATFIQKRNGKEVVCHCKEVYTDEEMVDRNEHLRTLERMRRTLYREEYRTEQLINLSETYEHLNLETLGGVLDAYEEYRQNVLDCEWQLSKGGASALPFSRRKHLILCREI